MTGPVIREFEACHRVAEGFARGAEACRRDGHADVAQRLERGAAEWRAKAMGFSGIEEAGGDEPR